MTADSFAQAEHAPAKINLALHVTGQRPDRYHLIESLSVFTLFGDRLSVAASDTNSFVVTGPFAGHVPDGAENLVIRARDAFFGRFAQAAPTVAIALEKNIPAVSGVGGGSSDAAATLRALARLFGTSGNDPALASLAQALGADVPMCLAAAPLIARGIGEQLDPVADFPILHLVLVNPGVAVETPRVFSALASKHNAPLPPLPGQLDRLSLLEWLATTRNDLFAPALALAPAIGEAHSALTVEGAAFARMSGSGATCFGIFPDAEAAAGAARAIGSARPGWFVAATRTMA